MHITVYGTMLSQGPLTPLYNFDSGSAFYNLIVRPHRVNLFVWIRFWFSREIIVSDKQQWGNNLANLTLFNHELSYLSSLTIRAEKHSMGVILSSLLDCLPYTVIYLSLELKKWSQDTMVSLRIQRALVIYKGIQLMNIILTTRLPWEEVNLLCLSGYKTFTDVPKEV